MTIYSLQLRTSPTTCRTCLLTCFVAAYANPKDNLLLSSAAHAHSPCLHAADAHPFNYMVDLEEEWKRFDPDGHYVRRWLPVLSQLPAQYIHQPWKAPPEVLEEAGGQGLGDMRLPAMLRWILVWCQELWWQLSGVKAHRPSWCSSAGALTCCLHPSVSC